ncbi:hypothetical protein HN873_063577 [Arachis hypogaea]
MITGIRKPDIILISNKAYILNDKALQRQYTFLGNGRDDTLFYAWLGCKSVTEDKIAFIYHMNIMADSARTNPVVA